MFITMAGVKLPLASLLLLLVRIANAVWERPLLLHRSGNPATFTVESLVVWKAGEHNDHQHFINSLTMQGSIMIMNTS